MELSKLARRLLPPSVRPLARRQLVRYRYLGLRPTDALLISYPKSGSTWLRFLLAQALTGDEADFDSIRHTLPPVGRHRRAPTLLPDGGRVARSHEPLHPYRGRLGQPVIYLVRDGRTVVLSYLEHQRREGRYAGGVATFVDWFLDGRVDGYGPWHEHVVTALEFQRSSGAPFLLVRYEDLRADPEGQLARALRFLGIDPDAELVRQAVASNTKDAMRAKEATSTFLAGHRTDNSPFVGLDARQGWADLVPAPTRSRFEAVCGVALEAAGYALEERPSSSVEPS